MTLLAVPIVPSCRLRAFKNDCLFLYYKISVKHVCYLQKKNKRSRDISNSTDFKLKIKRLGKPNNENKFPRVIKLIFNNQQHRNTFKQEFFIAKKGGKLAPEMNNYFIMDDLTLMQLNQMKELKMKAEQSGDKNAKVLKIGSNCLNNGLNINYKNKFKGSKICTFKNINYSDSRVNNNNNNNKINECNKRLLMSQDLTLCYLDIIIIIIIN